MLLALINYYFLSIMSFYLYNGHNKMFISYIQYLRGSSGTGLNLASSSALNYY